MEKIVETGNDDGGPVNKFEFCFEQHCGGRGGSTNSQNL